MATLIHEEDLDAIALGGAFLGTGGGGDPYIGKLMAREAIRRHGPVTLLGADEVADEALCISVFMMGAPTVMVEKLPSGAEILKALAELEQFLGRKADALICVEAGGLNSTIPFMVAASTGLPLIDGDGMGRAFPELQMVSFTLHGLAATPMVLADDKGNSALFSAISNLWTEKMARSVTIEMGGAALVAAYPMPGAEMKTALLHGTMTQIRKIGETIQEARNSARHAGSALRDTLGGTHLFTGRVIDVERKTIGGFARGKLTLRGVERFAGQQFIVHFQNEFLLAEDETGKTVWATPDLICALDADLGLPVTTEQMRYGLMVEFTGLAADPQWRTPEGLALAGPGYFGYGGPSQERIPV
ncbi:DUF917 domain-containing protein [Allorhizobium sp. BGMRC 0089]|uniref:DUF917 domain-containing protein n=1 Tax=Allorhizobium sonneratiae TaxID=2934936 RepID=UPI0020337492|nr:DUF917 domain-containing protein [Allorhizobium sonneratiae]MCM2293149.1 DUF917 domain-containing protein [Allorhizobium sonneratiae]